MDMTTHMENATYVATLSGRFTFSDNPIFREVLDRVGNETVCQITLRMHNLSFIDSAGLGMLLLVYDEAVKHKKAIILEGMSGQVQRIFEMARFDQFFRMDNVR